MANIEYVTLPEAGSTNTWCREHASELSAPVVVRAVAQSAGRGQRGNSWESAPGQNLTFSILWHPEGVAPAEQFSISEAVALGVVAYLRLRGIEAKVKWPNDLYVGDRKICGILIEHSLLGSMLERSVIGVGINVNQEEFLSDAPNPVSMRQLTGRTFELPVELTVIVEEIASCLEVISTADGREKLHSNFLKCLWRGDGEEYPFRDVKENRLFTGVIEGVEPAGFLLVRSKEDGELKKYAFKEVEFRL
ncbi:MAG: biotin--[acetyl-CoA-carboxylase] ligase [Muribaculaceae bacterium]|nr:biotin--[acetyl-CoA-carboxylase] ligase [Muribaculaceae bacterium]